MTQKRQLSNTVFKLTTQLLTVVMLSVMAPMVEPSIRDPKIEGFVNTGRDKIPENDYIGLNKMTIFDLLLYLSFIYDVTK
jgi:hypothetical protein